MRFGTLLELQYPRPWPEDGERQFFQDVLEQVELTDQLGYHSVWEVEHHFLEEYAHSSSPEVFLAAISQRTKNLRLGHGIVLMPPGYNQTARVAERIATLDLVSNGRVEFGTGESSSRAELEGYGVPLEEKRQQWLECTEQVANMLAMDPYPGYEGRFFSMPTRNVVPKTVQKPHPPMWMACSNHEQIKLAARLGLGALGFALVDAKTAKGWIDEYYEIIKTECVPIGHTVNANIALTSPLSLDADEETARERGFKGRYFFTFASNHHYVDGMHKPGRTDIWEQYEQAWPILRESFESYGAPSTVGTPDQARKMMQIYEGMGCDEVLFMAQMGKIAHETSASRSASSPKRSCRSSRSARSRSSSASKRNSPPTSRPLSPARSGCSPSPTTTSLSTRRTSATSRSPGRPGSARSTRTTGSPRSTA